MTSRKPQPPPGFQYTNNKNEAIEPVWKYEHEKANEAENGRLGWAVFFLGLFVAFVFLLVLGNTARGETYPIRKENIGSASCVCVGRLSNKEQTQSAWVFVTNRHVATVTKRDRNGRIISQRLATLYVGSDDGKWIKARNVQTSSDADVASFHVLTTQGKFRTIKMLEGGPDGMTATVCGYSPDRRAFCLTGTMNGNKVRGDRGAHVLWGDSGGPVIVEIAGADYMAGLAYGFGDHDRQTWFVSSEECCNQLKASYGIAPQCVQYRKICPNGQCRPQPQQMPPGTYRSYERIEPQFLAPPRIERYRESRQPEIVEPPPTPVPDPISRAPLPPEPARGPTKKQIAAAVDTWMRENAGSLQIDADAVARIITKNYPERVRGPKGDPGIPPAQLADIKRRISSLEAGGAQPTRVDLPEGLASRLEALEARADQVVPIRVLNQDGSIYSQDKDHKWNEPIEIQLAPPQKGQTNGG